MKATSNLIMWLTIVLLVGLAMVSGLVLLLLAELYCPPLIRSRHRRRQASTPNSATVNTTAITGNNSSRDSPSPPLDILTTPAAPLADIEKQLLESPENQESGGIQQQDKVETDNGCSLVYISNPIYSDYNGTPFETPDSSPSRLETEDSSDDDKTEEISSMAAVTPPLTPMKKLPAVACSVCLRDVRSLGTLGSDTNSINGVSSSCSLTPCTSPSL